MCGSRQEANGSTVDLHRSVLGAGQHEHMLAVAPRRTRGGPGPPTDTQTGARSMAAVLSSALVAPRNATTLGWPPEAQGWRLRWWLRCEVRGGADGHAVILPTRPDAATHEFLRNEKWHCKDVEDHDVTPQLVVVLGGDEGVERSLMGVGETELFWSQQNTIVASKQRCDDESGEDDGRDKSIRFFPCSIVYRPSRPRTASGAFGVSSF
jgi:hypothetical protein